jgi:hypothetical protein
MLLGVVVLIIVFPSNSPDRPTLKGESPKSIK